MRRPLVTALLVAGLAAAGCSGSDDPPTTTTAPAAAVESAASSSVRLSRIGSFDQPTHVAAPPGDSKRLFVVEQEGRIRVLVNRRLRSRPFLDIASDVACCGERGLLSMAFAPDYATSGRFYVYFTADGGDIVVEQFRRSSSAQLADRGSRREVLRIEHSRFGNHNGGQLQFGRDGFLYLGTGDGGGAGDPLGSGQRLDTLLGKILRIDPRPGGGYAVPSDNPFRGREGARGEIWSYGLRNPFRFSFDRANGALTVGDVGQNEFDEVDYVRRGGRGSNFGWNVYEARSRFRSGSAPGHVKPLIVSRLRENGNCALIGGYVVRDRSLKSLYGRYLWGDNCNPTIYSSRLSSSGASKRRSTGLRIPGLSSFGETGSGRVYATSLNGPVYRLVPR